MKEVSLDGQSNLFGYAFKYCLIKTSHDALNEVKVGALDLDIAYQTWMYEGLGN